MTAGHRIGWTVAGAVALGLIGALALVAGPLAGAAEGVLLGAALCAFALGWTALAVGSELWTDQPQRWAAVPATVLALVGGAFLQWPHSVAHDAAGWALPAIMLALAVWMSVQARRHLRSRARGWVLYPVFAVMATGSIAAGVETAREQADRRTYPSHGQLIDVGAYRLSIRCAGSGSPTVVLIPGAGETSASWAWIAPAVARDTRVCVYDRAGRAWSDAGPGPQDGIALARDLHALLERANGEEPVVLVGHSVGGLYARVYASEYPAQVGGVVLLDATHPEMFTRVPRYPRTYEIYRRVSALFPTLARFGVGRLAYRSNFDSLPVQARAEQRAHWATPALARSQRDEWAELPTVMAQAGALESFGALPLMVVTALRGAEEGWMELQCEWASLSSNSVHRVAGQASHTSLIDTRPDAAFSSRAILDVVAAVRTSGSLKQSTSHHRSAR